MLLCGVMIFFKNKCKRVSLNGDCPHQWELINGSVKYYMYIYYIIVLFTVQYTSLYNYAAGWGWM